MGRSSGHTTNKLFVEYNDGTFFRSLQINYSWSIMMGRSSVTITTNKLFVEYNDGTFFRSLQINYSWSIMMGCFSGHYK